ncbi:fucose 4-O-acetylase-like acetyltransferase [Microcella putealis]|uniref:Fucose 4-O-acetylase-like acetyltransferase n=1 Tax=Microcella putealis TaxID=337005 RepID=A0A4Q7LVW8_9MICO|nr:acyltransferase family protein [Microcella putealis]RZS59205.1 fucose 4-O-acetylase-like acetyltransferase [Microcella putealis]TQM24231.1 fucose 4-O-acetylase-like acetyltransferase [Microcella putealis]
MADATPSGSSAAQGSPGATTIRARTPYWDNSRAIAIVLVVVGHAIQPLNSMLELSYATYLVIYAFHMPAFALLAGYFSRAEPGAKQLGRIVTDLLVPYLVLQTVWTLIRFAAGEGSTFDPASPSWTLWFLLALAVFRMVLPVIARLRTPLLITVALSVGVGYFDSIDTTFSLSRTFGLLPFFTLGWWLADRGVIDRLRWLELDRFDPRVLVTRAVAATAFGAAAVVALVGNDFFGTIGAGRILFYADDYAALGLTEWWAGIVRLLVIGIGVALTLSLLALVPRTATPITWIGTHTMYVYLLHTFPLYALRQSDLTGVGAPAWLWFIGLLVGSVLLTLLLSSKPVRFVTRPIVEPRVGWLLARER